ncbi:MAG: exosortase [Acidobacteria bacterium]|nr:exosortase [Acidobacteriota bacterium]
MAPVVLIISFALLYRDVLTGLVADWMGDQNYSHGFLIVPLALYFAWERRRELAEAPGGPSIVGLFIALGSISLLVAGVLGSEFFLTRVSMVGTIAGVVLFVLGPHHLRVLAFPLAFLLLMIPIPAIVFNQIAFPLQLFASWFGETALAVSGVPVLREGNLIVLTDTTLEVAEACSGIRSLVSLFTLGVVYAYFMESRTAIRVILACATVPIAIITNGCRIAGTGVAAQVYGSRAAEGFFHTFSGWLLFVMAFGLLFLLHRGLLVAAGWAQRARISQGGAARWA